MNKERYQRQIVLPEIGLSGQHKLLEAKVLVVGAGGLGVPVLQYLVSMGVGHIGIVDDDVVSLSNLQRQVLYRTEDIGKAKVAIAKKILQRLNPDVKITAFREKLTSENVKLIMSDYDIIVDCTDNLQVRYTIDDECLRQNKPFVYGALYKYEGQVSVFNYLGTPGYRHLFPDDQAQVDNCAEIGVLGVLPGILGCYQAMEVVKIITGVGKSLAGSLLVIDAAAGDHYTINLAAQKPSDSTEKQAISDEEMLSWQQLDELKPEQYEWIDIRPESQYEERHDDRFKNVPFSRIFSFTPSGKPLILVCEQGKTTQQAVTILQSEFPDIHTHQVKGGYSSHE